MFESFIDFLVCHGSAGMFLAAFLAGSFFPFSSEVVMLALFEGGADATGLVLWGTAGNTLGSLFNFGIGRLGREEWIERYAKVSHEKLVRGQYYVRRYGAWAGFFAWLPILGTLLCVAMGFLRTNVPLSILTMVIGKYARYQALIYTWMAAH